MATLGNKIYDLRKKSGLSQEQLGFEIDVTRQTVSKWEQDTMMPTMENIKSMCKFFDISADFFLNDDIELAAVKVSTIKSKKKRNPFKDPCSKVRLATLTALTVILTLAFIVGAVVIGVVIVTDYEPYEGAQSVHSIYVDWRVVSFALCVLALVIAVITYNILKFKAKEKVKNSEVDKMSTEDGGNNL